MKPELDHQIKFLKFCGIFKTVPVQMKDLVRIFRSYIIFATTFSIILVSIFISKHYTNVLEIAECIAPLVSAVFMLIKYAFLIIYSDKVFDMIKEVKAMNEECRLRCRHSGLKLFSFNNKKFMGTFINDV